MELDDSSLDGFWSEDDNGRYSFFIINDAVISKLCILGEDTEPCFEGSQITRVQFSFEDSFQQKIFSMMEEVKALEEKGGTDSVEDEVKEPEMEEEVKDEEVKPELEEETPAEPEVEETPEEEAEEEPADEEEALEEEQPAEEVEEENLEEPEVKNVEYNLDDIQEYIELKSDYDELKTQFDNMKADYDKLVEFKKVADRKEKQAMIDRFYMLTDDYKKDVIENIDNYSVDDIEAKLSVICFRNGISFDLDNESEESSPTTFNLEEEVEDDLTPAWIKAVLATKKEME
jgi:hypothetical protein